MSHFVVSFMKDVLGDNGRQVCRHALYPFVMALCILRWPRNVGNPA